MTNGSGRPAAVEVRGLVKEFGSRRALDGLDLVVPTGSVFGLLGANGAGKTTTLRILLGLARPTAGDVHVLGERPGSAAARARIGYCPDVPGFLPWMTATDVLTTAARLFHLPPATTRARTTELLELTGLAGVDARVGGYSRGMRQRLGIAQALINAPDLLVLDEPTSALDPLGRRAVLELLGGLRGRTTVLFSTHLLPDVERVCDQVAIVDHGRVALTGPLAEVRARYGVTAARFVITVDDPVRLRAALNREAWVSAVTESDAPGELVLTVTDPDTAAGRIPRLLADAGLSLRRFEPRESSLEDVFLSLVGASA
ncbi:MAG TPA: ABC transporter ATP-binding protein [Candidatus Lumbricidophila sp.]|nr:ABC transporter ATP-binding protein [Candidatus Lumbricidophila sp.]